MLKEQEIISKYHRHNTTQKQQCTLISNAVVGAIPVVSRVDGGVARQQQLHDGNATIRGGIVKGGHIAKGTNRKSEASITGTIQHKISKAFSSAMRW